MRRDRFRGALVGPGRRGRGRHDGRVQAARDVRAGAATWSAAARSRCPPARGPTTRRWRSASPSRLIERRDVRPRRPARALRALVPRRPLVEHRALLRHRQRDARGARALRADRRAVPRRRRADAAGNGPLMKLAPVVLAYASRPADAIRFAGESARTTHGAPEAIDASRCVRRAADRRARRRAAAAGAGAVDAARPQRAPADRDVAPRSPRPASRRRCAAAATSSTRSRPRCGRSGRRRASRTACSPRSTSATTRTRPPRSTASSRARSTASTASRALAREGPRHDAIVAFADALYDLDVARPAIARFEHIKPDADRRVRHAPGRRRRPRASASRSRSAAAVTTSPAPRRPQAC